MSIELSPEVQKTAESLIAVGRYASIEEVVSAGIKQLASTEAMRSQVQQGIDQADRGELIDHDTAFTRLRLLAASLDGATE